MAGFELLSQYYDRFVGADYKKIISFISNQLGENASLVCDVGCGSGTVTLGLLSKGYDMVGIDGSIEMLTVAMNKRAALPNGEKALFLCQQLPVFELYGTVDAIISTLDTVNYLTDPEDLDQLFYWFRNYLNPEGLLIFDVNSLYKYKMLLDDHCEIYEEQDVFLSWRSSFDGDFCSHQLTYFNKEGSVYTRQDEEQQQRYYAREYIEELLEKYNFKILGVYDDYTDSTPGEKTQRITYVAKKE